ncbi:hypothetical protein ACJX0J_006163, partial [Zea mays]
MCIGLLVFNHTLFFSLSGIGSDLGLVMPELLRHTLTQEVSIINRTQCRLIFTGIISLTFVHGDSSDWVIDKTWENYVLNITGILWSGQILHTVFFLALFGILDGWIEEASCIVAVALTEGGQENTKHQTLLDSYYYYLLMNYHYFASCL